jgi:hypothetical protein
MKAVIRFSHLIGKEPLTLSQKEHLDQLSEATLVCYELHETTAKSRPATPPTAYRPGFVINTDFRAALTVIAA